MLKSVLSWIIDHIIKLWQAIVNLFFSIPEIRGIGWLVIGIIYIAFLMIFTHIDLIISTINNEQNEPFINLAMKKHANLVSLVTNIGLLMFLFIDLAIAYNKRIPSITATILNIIGILACVGLLMFSLGCVEPDMKSYGAIAWDSGVILSWSIFFVSLIGLKTKALIDNERDS